MQLDLDGRGTRYEQLARALKRSSLEGRLKPGVRLPATRELAADPGCCSASPACPPSSSRRRPGSSARA